jgi:uncharacterized membrane protein YkoI
MKIRSTYRGTAAGISLLALMLTTLWLGSGYSGFAAADSLDQDQVLKLLNQGEILPLEEILQRHRDQLQGRLIDLELEHHKGRWVYELELLDAKGVVREYLIDAKSGKWLGQE